MRTQRRTEVTCLKTEPVAIVNAKRGHKNEDMSSLSSIADNTDNWTCSPVFNKILTIAALSFTVTSLTLALLTPIHALAEDAVKSEPQSPPEISTTSDRVSLRVADKLAAKNTNMYGAFWCSHCYEQKLKFGKQAFAKLTYIECDRDGKNSQAQLCRDKRIPGYPTWEINGELFPGEIDVAELERLIDES